MESHKFGDVAMNEQAIERDLNVISGKRIFFGHQSVGENILEGIGDLAKAVKDVHVNIVDIGKGRIEPGPFFAESRIGKNGKPDTKCEAFGSRVRELLQDSLDVAVMKLCYVDFTRETDVKTLFALYRETIDSLQAMTPALTFVHVTVPLTARTPGWKKLLKKVLGREDASDIENARRNEYNDLLRQYYNAKPLFDLATLESTYPDGSREEFSYQGRTIYTLIGELSDDGAHLNREGRDIAAREFVRVLAAASGPEAR
jgi:hypothetical protein